MAENKNFLEDIVERTFRNLDIVTLAAGTALLFPTAASVAALVGGAYLVAQAVDKHHATGTQERRDEPVYLKRVQQDINSYLNRYKAELGTRLRRYGFDVGEIRNYLDQVIRNEDIVRYMRTQPRYT